MRVISICRQVFNIVFMLSTLSYLIMGFREQMHKGEKEDKKEKDVTELSKEKKWYDILQITIVICALIIFLLFVIYGISNKKFIWLFLMIGIPASLERIAHALISIGIVGNVVKTNANGALSFKEHTAIFLVSCVVIMLQVMDCFEHSINFVTNRFGSITSDLLSLLIHVLVLFVYFFLTCSLVPMLTLFGTKTFKKIIVHIPGKHKVKKCGDFFAEKIDKPIKQSQIAVSFLKTVKRKNTIIKILSTPVAVVASIMDIVFFLFNTLCSFMITSLGYIVIIYRIVKNGLKNMFGIVLNLSDKKNVAVSFRIAIIAALSIVVIMNRYNIIVKNVDESTAVLEFIASSIIIPVAFEWIYSGRMNSDIENNKD